ncbi:DUF1415 domain-containing protein [Halothiobacillus sp.]|jgi:hypothetical protein|uniref:DUF1415 domain-containing protein n=1 Tax=Halothiobacillus sp. TaxID=1891311 RepID=UPI00260BD4B9|nr:DUF1415 domain-containing protein [Halothiobacillus sp.]MDD4967021.1 DUF1415 domain-containing protein [Halothiobacillus sp.]
MPHVLDNDTLINTVRQWVEQLVIGYNLCPFAKRELVRDRVRFVVSRAQDEEQLLVDLENELTLLGTDEGIETTLLITPQVLQDFFDFNQFLGRADRRVAQLKLKGVFQIASFHPDYQFGGTEPDDAENYTNKSPYPVLHLLREASLDRAIENYPDAESIPERNIEQLELMGSDQLRRLLEDCFNR